MFTIAFPHVPLSRAEFFFLFFFWHKITHFMALSKVFENAFFLVSTTRQHLVGLNQFFSVKPTMVSSQSEFHQSGFASRMETEL